MNIAIIGGGKACELIIEHFVGDSEINLVGICDLSEDAPAIIRAKELAIPTYTEMKEMIIRPNVELVIELTGNTNVSKKCMELLRNDQDMMSSGGARLLYIVLQSIGKFSIKVADELHDLTSKMANAMGTVDKTAVNIKSILIKIQMIAINGNIEACKAGKNGAAFAVVAQHLGELVNEVDFAVEQIVKSSAEGHLVLNSLRSAEKALRKEA